MDKQNKKATMKAVVYEKYGSPEVLHVSDVNKPTPKPEEVLVRVLAAEATKADCEMRSFTFPVKWFWLPLRIALGVTKPKNKVLGGYFSGEIESAGEEVTQFKPGEQVFGSAGLRMGAYGEYLCLPSKSTITPKPENMSFAEAAVVPLGGLNALHYLRRAEIKPGEHVLVNGAGGSIGLFAVQIAKFMGAEVTAVDSSIKQEMLRELGADHFIDYDEEDFTKNTQTYDVIFNMVAKSSYTACINCLKSGGRYLMGNPRLSYMFRSVFTTRFTDKKAIFAFAGEKKEELQTLKEMIESNQIRSVIDKVYSYNQAAEAHRRVETEKRIGSVVLSENIKNE